MRKVVVGLAAFLVSMSARAEVVSSFSLKAADLFAVSRLFEIESKKGDSYEVDVLESQIPLLLSVAPTAKLLEKDVAASIRARLQKFSLTSSRGYHSFDQVQEWMKAHAKAHQDLASIVDYGLSRAGRPLTALRITTDASAKKPVVMITAATHGDELVTTEVLMHLVDRLIDSYHKEDRLTKIVDSHDIYFVPVLNPDGFTQTNRYDGNADPNRSYPYPQHEAAQPTPSIAGIIKLFSGLEVVASIDFHAYGGMIMYPWAYTHDSIDAAHRAKFDAATKYMAATNNYAYGPISDVIYVAPGSSADYYFWKKASFSLGIEIGDDKVPDPSEFPKIFDSQEESTWRFLEGV